MSPGIPQSIRDIEAGPPAVIYDGECPFCSNYVQLLRLRDVIGDIRLINARELPEPLLRELQADFDLDRGMIFSFQGKLHYGGDAMHQLALLSSGGPIFRCINAVLLKRVGVARWLYPALRAGRNLALRVKGKGQIHDRAGANAH